MVSLGLEGLGFWTPWENLSYRLLFQGREVLQEAQPDWDPRIAVIAVDDRSLQELGALPLSRDLYGILLDQLTPAQPAAIGIDLIFTDETEQDTALGDAIFHSGAVVLAMGNDSHGRSLAISPEIQKRTRGSFLLGHVAHRPDDDGLSRRMQLYIGDYPALGVAVVQMAATNLSATVRPSSGSEDEASSIAEAAERLENASSKQLSWLNWPGPVPEGLTPSDLRVYSFVDVLRGSVAAQTFQNQIVLIGVTATGFDVIRTPFNLDPPTAGVYFHAAAIQNLLDDSWLRPLSGMQRLLLLSSIAMLTPWILASVGVRQRLYRLVGCGGSWIVLAQGLFLGNIWLPVAAPLGTLLLALVILQGWNRWEQQQLEDLFEMAVAPETAALLWQHKQEILQQGGIAPQQLTATVMFLDIRGFTAIAEKLPETELISWLRQFFTLITDCVLEHGGIVHKYMGDAAMAIFGSPVSQQSSGDIRADAIAAVTASLAMQKRIHQLNHDLAAHNWPTLTVGIGLHTGSVIAGSVGTRRRMDYSVFGDTVNVASRLEQFTKQLSSEHPYKILVSEATFRLVDHQFKGQALGEIYLRGRQTSIQVFAVHETVAPRDTAQT